MVRNKRFISLIQTIGLWRLSTIRARTSTCWLWTINDLIKCQVIWSILLQPMWQSISIKSCRQGFCSPWQLTNSETSSRRMQSWKLVRSWHCRWIKSLGPQEKSVNLSASWAHSSSDLAKANWLISPLVCLRVRLWKSWMRGLLRLSPLSASLNCTHLPSARQVNCPYRLVRPSKQAWAPS